MTNQEPLNETLNMEFRELMLKKAATALGLSEYVSFVDLVEKEQVAQATNLLTEIQAHLMELDDDDSLDKFSLVSNFLDDWVKFTESKGAEQVVANYAAERLKMYGG